MIGVLLSGVAAYRVHDQELTIDGIALARAIDIHASLVQDRLTERELLARVASGLFRAPSVMKANMLQPLRASIYAFKTDFVVASWVARLAGSGTGTRSSETTLTTSEGEADTQSPAHDPPDGAGDGERPAR